MDRFAGEPTLDELLSDPVIRRVMEADGIDRRGLCRILAKAAGALPSAEQAAAAASQAENS